MRNLVKHVPFSRQIEIATYNARKYNETWYIFGSMVGNAKGRKGYEQFTAICISPDGEWSMIKATPRNIEKDQK